MPRGVRKNVIEKLQEELNNTKEEIVQYKAAIKTKEQRIKDLEEAIRMEELKELSNMLEENNMSITQLKEIISKNNKE